MIISKIPNVKNIDPYFLDLPFDPDNKYSLPYFWGTLGIAFNPTLLDGQTFESWDNLWDPFLKQQVILVDSAREISWDEFKFIRLFFELDRSRMNCEKLLIS